MKNCQRGGDDQNDDEGGLLGKRERATEFHRPEVAHNDGCSANANPWLTKQPEYNNSN